MPRLIEGEEQFPYIFETSMWILTECFQDDSLDGY